MNTNTGLGVLAFAGLAGVAALTAHFMNTKDTPPQTDASSLSQTAQTQPPEICATISKPATVKTVNDLMCLEAHRLCEIFAAKGKVEYLGASASSEKDFRTIIEAVVLINEDGKTPIDCEPA
jgi:hypothetical protein